MPRASRAFSAFIFNEMDEPIPIPQTAIIFTFRA